MMSMFVVAAAFVMIPFTPIFCVGYLIGLLAIAIFYGFMFIWTVIDEDDLDTTCFEDSFMKLLSFFSIAHTRSLIPYYNLDSHCLRILVGILTVILAFIIAVIGTIIEWVILITLFALGIAAVPIVSVCVWFVLIMYLLRIGSTVLLLFKFS